MRKQERKSNGRKRIEFTEWKDLLRRASNGPNVRDAYRENGKGKSWHDGPQRQRKRQTRPVVGYECRKGSGSDRNCPKPGNPWKIKGARGRATTQVVD